MATENIQLSNDLSEFNSPYVDLNDVFIKRGGLLDRIENEENKLFCLVLRKKNKELFDLAVQDRDLSNLIELSTTIEKQKQQLVQNINSKKIKIVDCIKEVSEKK